MTLSRYTLTQTAAVAAGLLGRLDPTGLPRVDL